MNRTSAPAARAVKSALGILVIASLAMAFAACSTTEGFGKDIKNTGEAIEDSAERNK